MSRNASSAFPRFVTPNGTVMESPAMATYRPAPSATSRPATRSTTRNTDSPAEGADRGGRAGAFNEGTRPGFAGAGFTASFFAATLGAVLDLTAGLSSAGGLGSGLAAAFGGASGFVAGGGCSAGGLIASLGGASGLSNGTGSGF